MDFLILVGGTFTSVALAAKLAGVEPPDPDRSRRVASVQGVGA